MLTISKSNSNYATFLQQSIYKHPRSQSWKIPSLQAPILGVIRLDYNYPPAPGDIDCPGSSSALGAKGQKAAATRFSMPKKLQSTGLLALKWLVLWNVHLQPMLGRVCLSTWVHCISLLIFHLFFFVKSFHTSNRHQHPALLGCRGYDYDVLFRVVPGFTFEMAMTGKMSPDVEQEWALQKTTTWQLFGEDQCGQKEKHTNNLHRHS